MLNRVKALKEYMIAIAIAISAGDDEVRIYLTDRSQLMVKREAINRMQQQ